jgi:hypothetical protein
LRLLLQPVAALAAIASPRTITILVLRQPQRFTAFLLRVLGCDSRRVLTLSIPAGRGLAFVIVLRTSRPLGLATAK